MKLFKWHLIDDIELRCYENGLVREYKKRLEEEKESWKRVATKNFNEAEDYKAIIKEVREYIEKNTDNTNFLEVPSKELLEILDKGE